MNISEKTKAIAREAAKWRQTLHQHPQTSYEETFCRDFVIEKLKEFGIEFQTNIAKTGIVATLKGKQDTSGKAIGLRADMDALDIHEENQFEYKSKFDGKMHACGHDGHTAMLLGAAKLLAEDKDFNGTAHFIFQPAEEGGAGGKMMIRDGLFDNFKMDSVWGMHNLPGLSVGKIATRVGSFLAGTTDFNVTLEGKGGHAAMPHKTKDPILALAQIINLTQSIISRRIDPIQTGVISITGVKGGMASNIIPDKAEFFGTIRALDPNTLESITGEFESIVTNCAKGLGLNAIISWEEHPYPPVVNTSNEVLIANSVAEKTVGADNLEKNYPPMMGGEDFAFMLQKKTGCFIFIGNGDYGQKGGNGLHTSKYDFNDDIISHGMQYWVNLVKDSLKV